MIFESSYWKDDLLKLAKKLELRLIQKRWTEKSFFAVEKELFLGFYSIRKLIESLKVSESVAGKLYRIYEYPKINNSIKILSDDPTKEFDLTKGRKVDVSVATLCNQFIHSYHFAPFAPEGKSLVGFFVCSDYKRKTGIYLVTIFDVVDMYRQVGNNYPASFSANKTEDGRIHTQVE